MPTYARANLSFERGEGVYLFDSRGRRYLDFSGGVAVLSLGHCHPRLVEALQSQAATLWHTSNQFRVAGQERLAERLVAHSFADTVFFANSGAEAVECGLKLVRKYHDETGTPHRYRVVTFEGAFHGRTLATISAGGQPKHLAGFEPAVDGFDHVPFGDLDAVRRAVTDETAAILVEPVQGEAGARVPPPGFLRSLRDICDREGLLLFLDEVQSGIGRTGRLFACEWEGVSPDLMAVAKGLGGGFPIGACLATEAAAAGMGAGSHGSTFGGNPLAMAVGNAVLDVVLAAGFLESVRAMSGRFNQMLAPLAKEFPQAFSDLLGLGFLIALRCVPSKADVIARLRAEGLLTAGAGDNAVRLLPPLIAEESHIAEARAALESVGRSFAS
jgi:acetylornithine/N-succinyldiaminopimelate aminotransferase